MGKRKLEAESEKISTFSINSLDRQENERERERGREREKESMRARERERGVSKRVCVREG